MNIKVIGSGCENCDKTNAVVKECLEELGIDTEIERVTDLVEIVKLGVMTAPSVMIDGKLVVAGQVPSKKQMMKIMAQSMCLDKNSKRKVILLLFLGKQDLMFGWILKLK